MWKFGLVKQRYADGHTMAMSLLLLVLALPLGVFAQQDVSTLFLVAGAQMRDPSFSESVVLVTRHGRSEPMGVILNKPSNVKFGLPGEKGGKATPGHVLHFGGPVSPQMMVYLFKDELNEAAGMGNVLRLGGGLFMGMGRQIPLALLMQMAPTEFRVFSGFASWGPGQLENEIARGEWLVLPFDPAIPLQGDTSRLWEELLARASQRKI